MTALILALLASTLLQAPAPVAPAASPTSANVWSGRTAEVEAALRTAPVQKMQQLELGVTRPKRAFTAPGSAVASFAWKPLRPGMYRGYWESYKSEIAAYELDKQLGLGMVPVVVERRIDNELGAAVLWLDGVRTWESVLNLPKPASWNLQLVRMKMFDALIGNRDRNKGNLLVDADWNLYLIDHSRAFERSKALPPTIKLERVERALWEQMAALDEPGLQAALGAWIDRGQIRAILQRRDRMKEIVDQLVATAGEGAYIR